MTPEPHGTWVMRRRFMMAVMGFCMATITYVLYTKQTGAVAETTVTMAFTAMISCIGSYVFGAAWQGKKGSS